MTANLTDGTVNPIPVRTVADPKATLLAAIDHGQYLYSWKSLLGTQYFFLTDLGFQSVVVPEPEFSDPVEAGDLQAKLDHTRTTVAGAVDTARWLTPDVEDLEAKLAEHFGEVEVSEFGRKAGLK